MAVKIRGTKMKQGEVEFIVGVVSTHELLPQVEVDEWSPSDPEGYQRAVVRARAREFGRYMAKGGFSPSSLLLNIRTGSLELVKQGSESEFEVPDDVSLWEVDGQHRIKGLELISEEHPSLLDLELPVILMALGGGDAEEARYKEALQFLIINRTQKGVRADLAERILLQVSEREGGHRIALGLSEALPSSLARDMDWRPRAVQLSDLLNKRQDSPLRGMIRLPNLRTKGATVSQGAVTGSLKQVLGSDSVLRGLSNDELASVLINLWGAVRELCPEPFEEVEETAKAAGYVLLKTTGINVFHKVLLGLVALCPREDGVPVLSKDALREVLSRAQDLMQSPFWQSSGEGTAGAIGTGQKSFSTIAGLILDAIGEGTEQGGLVKVILA